MTLVVVVELAIEILIFQNPKSFPGKTPYTLPYHHSTQILTHPIQRRHNHASARISLTPPKKSLSPDLVSTLFCLPNARERGYTR